VDRVGGQQYLAIDINRNAIARYRISAEDVNDVIETVIAGKTAAEVYALHASKDTHAAHV
jgi:cobalt-zinc-cadmium resistance protein CzcA